MDYALSEPRTVDEFGRVVLPREVRRILGLGERDKVVFYAEDGRVYITKMGVVEEN